MESGSFNVINIEAELQDKRTKIAFIKKYLGACEISKDGENVAVVCPSDVCRENHRRKGKKSRKLVININDDMIHCWVCNIRGTFSRSILAKYYPQTLSEYKEKFGIGKIKQPVDGNEDRQGRLKDSLNVLNQLSSGLNVNRKRKW